MPTTYRPQGRGYRIQYTLYFPDGTRKTKTKERKTKILIDELYRKVENLEIGSRRQDLTRREIVSALHEGLLTPTEAKKLTGGETVAIYDLDKVMKHYETANSIAKTPYAHKVDMRRARQLEKWLGERSLIKLTEIDIREYIQGRKNGEITFTNRVTRYHQKGVSPKTIKNELQILRKMIDTAIELGMTKVNVARNVNIPIKSHKVRRALSKEEIKKIVATAKENRYLCRGYIYEVVMLAIYTGLRRGEIRSLCWEDIHLDTRKIYIQAKMIDGEEEFTPKNGEASTVNIPNRLYEVLVNMEQKGPYVFGGEKPLPPNLFYKGFKDVVLRAGLDPSLTLHHTRHTYGSTLLQLTGGDLRYVQEKMRHADINTTKQYMHTIMSGNAPEMVLNYGEE